MDVVCFQFCIGLELLDKKFEKFYAQYDDDEFGSSDDDTMATEHDKQILDQVVEDFENNFKVKCKMLVVLLFVYDHIQYQFTTTT